MHAIYKKKDKYVANRYIHEYVARLQPFENHKGTCFGHWETKFIYEPVTGQLSHTVNIGYAVYSYGSHFPIYFYDKETDQWYGNNEKYSSTTSRHQSYARPTASEDIKWVSNAALQYLTKYGAMSFLKHIRMGVPV